MTAAPYPLDWPEYVDRAARRERSAFRTELPGALKNVRKSLEMFGVDSNRKVSDVVISSNATLGVDKPEDPGVAVWFKWDDMVLCIPADRYATPAENLQAVHHILEAKRVELRHGTLAMVKASFRGLTALPAPAGRPRKPKWFEVLGVPESTRDEATIANAYRSASATAHPDRPGGSHDAMARLNAARDEGLRLARAS